MRKPVNLMYKPELPKVQRRKSSTLWYEVVSWYLYIYIYIYTTEHRSPSENLIKSNDEYLWAKPVGKGLLVIRLSRPFAAKPAANWVMTR